MNYKKTKGKKVFFRASFRSGFTLIEVLTVIVIIATLTAVALPRYVRSVERARATEAMNAIKAMNDSIYAYFADKDSCPNFKQLVAAIPGSNAAGTQIETKNFTFTMGASVNVPGTDCPGVLATRNGDAYNYTIWNPYTRGTTGKALALQCGATDDKSIAVCESLGLYRSATEE